MAWLPLFGTLMAFNAVMVGVDCASGRPRLALVSLAGFAGCCVRTGEALGAVAFRRRRACR